LGRSFVLTTLAYFAESDMFGGTRVWPRSISQSWKSSNLIWLLWILGGITIVASWVRLVSSRAGWFGLTMGMVAVLASWYEEERDQLAILIGGAASFWCCFSLYSERGHCEGSPQILETMRGSSSGLRLVTTAAARLIRDELRRSPELSRAGAAWRL
jgi:hypothetical protein